MPTLRVELLRSREEDNKKSIIVEKRAVHSNRVNMVAGGYPQHATKLKYGITEPLKQTNDNSSAGKAPGVAKKLSKNEITQSNLHTSFKGQTPQSPSESDSFSIKSSSSSSKSEADSIKKPSPPTSLVKPHSASLSMSLGSYLGAQAVEMWDVTHMSPCDFSKAIHEKLSGEKTLQDRFLEYKFSQAKMVDSHLQRKKDEIKAARCVNAEHLRGGCGLKHDDSTNVEVLNEDWAHGLATPAFYSATARSPETSSEISCHSGDACNAPFIGQEIRHTQSIKDLMGSHKETRGVHAEQKPSHMKAHDHMHECMGDTTAQISRVTQEELSNDNAPLEAKRVLFKAEIISNPTQFEKRSSCPRALSCHVSSQSKHDDGFSFESVPVSKGTYKQDMTSCGRASVDRSTYPEVVADFSKEGSARVSLEKYIFSTPLMGRSVASAQSHSKRGKSTLSSPGHAHDGMMKVTRADVTPPPVHEIRCKANLEEFTPVSPLSLGEADNYQRFDEYNGKEYVDMAWFTTSKAQVPLHSPFKAQWDWRSRSLGARASLKSAVRNLEAAFGGSRSVSLPKTRSQTQKREKKPENSKFIDRVFVSPARARHKRTEILKPIERPSCSGDQDSMTSRRELRTHDCGREWAGSSHPIFPPLPLSKQHEISDFKVSSVPFPPTSRSVHDRLAPLKRLSGHTSPVVLMPPASATSQPNPSKCMQQGYLQCIVRDGVACYTLSLKNSEEMLLAKACTYGHDSSKWMYTFHSGKSKGRGKGANGWRSWLKKDSKCTSDLIGKMQVSSQLCADVSPTGKRTQSLVSEYVLHDERNDDAVRSQSLRFLSSSNTCHSTFTPAGSPSSLRSAYEFVHRKQVPDIPRSPSSARMSLKAVNSNLAPPYSPLKGTPTHQSSYSIDAWSDSDVTEPEVRRLGSYPSLHSELAAIVVKMPTDDPEVDDHVSIIGACRRSLKFSDDESKGYQGDLQKKVVQGAHSDSMMACGTRHGLLENRATSECVTMMLPKEHHGLPKGGVHGPTSLIERWKCGGKCDCGGWDLGCGMKVFSTQECEKLATRENHGNGIQSISHNQPLIIYSQGKTCEALLNLSLVQEGYFILKFKSELSPLKAFATSVAILHSRESSLTTSILKHTENAINQQCQSNSDVVDPVSKGNERPAFLEVCKEIPTWGPSNHLVSPYGRV